MRGFTLVELMISVTLGLVVLSGVGWVYLGTVRTYRVHDALSRMQEGARHAFELIGRDLRMTGASGCGHATHQNAVNASTDWYKNLFDQPLISYERDGAARLTDRSDALVVLHADVTREYIVQSHDSAGSQFQLMSPHDLATGELLLATDCSHSAVFQASSASGANVAHAVAGSPGNATPNLGAGDVPYSFTPGARIYRLSASAYFVADNAAEVPALFRQKPRGIDATPVEEELVEGVEDMQIAYGVDVSVPVNGQADFVDPDGDGDPYLTADQIESSGSVPGATAEERWARVVSVRVSLLMRTVEDRIASSAQQYTYGGRTVTADDLRVRKVFTHVVKLRNR